MQTPVEESVQPSGTLEAPATSWSARTAPGSRAGSGMRRGTGRGSSHGRFVALVVLLLLGGGLAGYFAGSSVVQVQIDGEVVTARTLATDVGGLLDRLEVEVGAADRVEPPLHTPIEDGLRVVVHRATSVEVVVDADPPLTVVTIVVDGEVVEIETDAGTVAGALEAAGVQIGAHDLVDPPGDHPLDTATEVTVRRVEVIEEVVEVAIEHDEVRRDGTGLVEGETRVQTPGSDGLRRETYEVTRVDGEATGRVLIAEAVIREPIDRVVLVGTAPGPVREAQRLLADLGYPVGPVDGIDGAQTRRGLCAWRRLEGHEVNRSALRSGELEAIRATSGLPAAPAGRGVTVDRTCQVLSHRQDGQWQHVHEASTGADGLPREGSYTIGRTRGGWHTSTLYPAAAPNMYNTLYFHGAIAIHGSNHVPPHPASAGCVRVTPHVADQLFADLRIGDPVRVIGSY